VDAYHLEADRPLRRPDLPDDLDGGNDRWLALACFTKAEWSALIKVAGRPEWGQDARFADLAARLRHQDALDALVAGLTKSQDEYQVMFARPACPLACVGHWRPLRQRPSTGAELADRGDRYQDRALADRRGPGQDERELRLHRRTPRLRRRRYGEDNEYV